MLLEHIHPDHGLVELRIRTLNQLIIQVLLIVHRVKPLQHELEQRVQVLGARGRDEDVGVLEADGGGDGQTEGGRFPPTSAGGQGDGGAEPLLADGLHELQQGLRLAGDGEGGEGGEKKRQKGRKMKGRSIATFERLT